MPRLNMPSDPQQLAAIACCVWTAYRLMEDLNDFVRLGPQAFLDKDVKQCHYFPIINALFTRFGNQVASLLTYCFGDSVQKYIGPDFGCHLVNGMGRAALFGISYYTMKLGFFSDNTAQDPQEEPDAETPTAAAQAANANPQQPPQPQARRRGPRGPRRR